MNYRFHLDEWLRRFPLEERYGGYSANIITSPWHLCQNENLRSELRDAFDWGPAVPVDIFVMADGEAPDRHATKIGGLPYRLANAAWPTQTDGNKLAFLAQFNFCDSKDLTGELPGDVLLIFADNVHGPDHLHFEWQRMGLSELVQPDGIPEPPIVVDPATLLERQKIQRQYEQQCRQPELNLPADLLELMRSYGYTPTPHEPSHILEKTNELTPCYGHIHRTVSFPEATARDDSSTHNVRSWYHLLQYQATQIGAAPPFIQDGDAGQLPGRPLCTISSVQPAPDTPYPWINSETPIPLRELHNQGEYLMIGDMGCIYISIDECGLLHWHESCY